MDHPASTRAAPLVVEVGIGLIQLAFWLALISVVLVVALAPGVNLSMFRYVGF